MTMVTIFQIYISTRFAINISKFVYKKLYAQKIEKVEKDGDLNVTNR